MSGKPDIWMPFFIGDYLRDTSRLTRDQHGAYLLLIFDYWTKGPPPDDARVLQAITKASVREWRALLPVLAPYFTIEGGKWTHGKIDKVKARQLEMYSRRQAAGHAGGEAARGKSGRRKNSKTIATVIANEIAKPIANEWQKNSITKPEPDAARAAEDARAKDTAVFQEICHLNGYDAKDDKNWLSFIALLLKDGVSRETLLATAKDLKRAGRGGMALSYLRPKAIEMRDAAALAGPAPVIFEDTDDEGWLERLRFFRRRGHWPAQWGPRPDEPGCKCPAEILSKSTPQKASAG